MTKRKQQQPPRQSAAAAPRKGVVVTTPDGAFTFQNATGWGVDASGVMAVGEPTGKFMENGQELSSTVAAFRTWDRVVWLNP